MNLAVFDFQAVGTVGALAVSLAGTYLVYRRGSKGDQALSLSQDADRRSKETETNLATQGNIIDQLQEEVTRYRGALAEKDAVLADKQVQLEETRALIREQRDEIVTSKAAVAASEVIVAGLDRTVAALQEEIESLRRILHDHESTIAAHERTINLLRAAHEDAQ